MPPLLRVFATTLLFAIPVRAQIAYWPFDNANQPWTDTITGMTGQPVGGTPSVNTTTVAPVVGSLSAAQFGGGDFLSVPWSSALGLSAGAPMSILVWVQPTGSAVPGVYHILGKRGTLCGAIEYQVARDSRGLHFTAGANLLPLGGAGPAQDLPMNTWSHVAVTWSGVQGSAGTFKLYRNGQLASSIAVAASSLTTPLTAPLQIGSSGSCGDTFTGLVDELRFYDRELSAAEIGQIASAPAIYSTFGVGCPGSAGVPLLSQDAGSLPQLGSSLRLTLENVPSGTLQAVGVLGFSNTVSQSILGNYPLPSSLGSLGMPGCTQFVSGDAAFLLQVLSGRATWAMAIPPSTNLSGVVFYLQAVVPDAGTNPLGGTVSGAGMAVVGS